MALFIGPMSGEFRQSIIPLLEKNRATAQYPWILNPVADMLFCCGGMAWILFILHYFVFGSTASKGIAQTFIVIAGLGTILFSETHTMATLVRVYRDDQTRLRFSMYTHWAALGFAALALGGLFIHSLVPIYAKIYLLIVSQHFTAQTYGIILLYCYKRNYLLANFEKQCLALLMNATMLYAILRQFTYPTQSEEIFLGQKLPFWGPLPAWILFVVIALVIFTTLGFIAIIISKGLSDKRWMPLPALFLTITGVSIFMFGSKMTGILWLYVPAFFHGSQYLIVSLAHYMKEQPSPISSTNLSGMSMLRTGRAQHYLAFLLMAAIFTYVGVPNVLAQFGFDYTIAFATIFTTMQFHHILIDRVIWKLREAKLRSILVS